MWGQLSLCPLDLGVAACVSVGGGPGRVGSAPSVACLWGLAAVGVTIWAAATGVRLTSWLHFGSSTRVSSTDWELSRLDVK